MNPQLKVKDEVDRLLEQIVVAPALDPNRYLTANRYLAVDPDRYLKANRDPDRYLTAASGGGRYGGGPPLSTTRYSNPGGDPDRYSRYGRGAPRRRLIHRTTIIIPPAPRTQGRLLWVPVDEYLQIVFNGEMEHDGIVRLGDGFYFDVDENPAGFDEDEDEDEDEDNKRQVTMVTCEKESDTFHEDSSFEFDENPLVRYRMVQAALQLRAELARNPARVTYPLTPQDLLIIQRIAVGEQGALLTQEQVLAAIRADPLSGVGAAALDFVVWERAGRYGALGERINKLNREIFSGQYVHKLLPLETLLVYSGSLHPGTQSRETGPGKELYDMIGSYAVARVGYHSDLTGKVMGGWRSLYLEPYDE